MSSILKALKKVEQETAATAGAPSTGAINGQPGRRTGSLVVPGLIAFTLCIFTGVGILIYTQNVSVSESNAPQSPAVSVNNENPMPPEIIPAETIPLQSRAEEVDARNAGKPVAATPEFEFATAGPSIADKQQMKEKDGMRELPDVQPQKMLPTMSPERKTAQPDFEYATAQIKTADPFLPIMPEPDMTDENRLPIDEDPEAAPAFRPEVSVVESSGPHLPDVRKNEFTNKPVVKKTEPQVAVIKDPAVELQAISWSADPDKRMAIINGKICREKDSVSGYVIQSINSGDVVLSKGSVKGKLIFEIR